MAIAFRSLAGIGGGNTAATVTMSAPAGLAEDDVVLFVTISGSNQDWESVADNNAVAATRIGDPSPSGNLTVSFWWYRCPATVPTEFTGDRGGGGGQPLLVGWAFSGCVDTGTPFEDATRAEALTTAETTPDTAEITTTGTNRMAVALVGVDDDPDYSSGMPPDGWTDAGGFSDTGGSDARADLIYQTVAAASTVSAAVVGTLPGAEFWASVTLALLPAAVGALTVNPTPVVAPTVIPAPAVGRALTVAASTAAIPAIVPEPAVELTLELAPVAATVALTVPTPTVTLGALTVSPDPTVLAASAEEPTIARTLATEASPAVATAVLPEPTVTPGALAFTADPAELTAAVAAPALERTLDVTPDPVATTVALMAPTVARTLAATAGPAVAELVVPAPAVSLSLAAAADPVETELVVPPPTVTVQGGALAMLPAPAIAAVVIPPPAVTMGAITLQPDPVALAIAAGQPAAELAMRTEAGPVVTVLAVPAPAVTFGVGQITIEPQPIVLTLVAPAPRVTSARVRITKEALVDRAWAAAQTRRPARISGRTAGV